MNCCVSPTDHRETSIRSYSPACFFGFVFIHPFMDLDGRLSRLVVHHCLEQSGTLPRGLVLPVSVAMKRHEDRYLAALQFFGLNASKLCEVRGAGGDEYW